MTFFLTMRTFSNVSLKAECFYSVSRRYIHMCIELSAETLKNVTFTAQQQQWRRLPADTVNYVQQTSNQLFWSLLHQKISLERNQWCI